jgi:hypothetical protein
MIIGETPLEVLHILTLPFREREVARIEPFLKQNVLLTVNVVE